jgi:hypothetical protein
MSLRETIKEEYERRKPGIGRALREAKKDALTYPNQTIANAQRATPARIALEELANKRISRG